jgi:hypothetical protein
MSVKFKYCVDGSEPVIKDMKAVNATYVAGQVMVAAAAEGGGMRSAAAGIATAIVGVTNEGRVLAGTQAAGTVESIKTIVNPGAVYAVEYDQGTRITWGTVTNTTIPFTSADSEGHPNIGGGWAWSYDTGKLDYVVSSATSSTTCTLTTVAGTDTSSDFGIILYPAMTGMSYIVTLNSAATKIAAATVDLGTAGTNGITSIILENRIESLAYGSEILDNRVHNQKVRYMAANTSFRDKAKIFAYVRFPSVLSA